MLQSRSQQQFGGVPLTCPKVQNNPLSPQNFPVVLTVFRFPTFAVAASELHRVRRRRRLPLRDVEPTSSETHCPESKLHTKNEKLFLTQENVDAHARFGHPDLVQTSPFLTLCSDLLMSLFTSCVCIYCVLHLFFCMTCLQFVCAIRLCLTNFLIHFCFFTVFQHALVLLLFFFFACCVYRLVFVLCFCFVDCLHCVLLDGCCNFLKPIFPHGKNGCTPA